MSVNDINDNKNDLINKENGVSIIKNDAFHAVYIPEESENISRDILHVYTDKLEALKLIKGNKTARLKSFASKTEAEDFAKYGLKQTNNYQNDIEYILPLPEIDEAQVMKKCLMPPSAPFKAPTSQELVRFRKIIEDGDADLVKTMVYDNPRYLIGSGYTPALLQEGCRYNALHIAAFKSSKPAEMCKLILTTVSDQNFIEALEGMESSKLSIDRAKMFLDLFLNTPDKGLNEIPLHFAAKFGLKDAVKLLVSYPECIKTYRNKYGQTPVDVICTRKCQENEDLRQEIRMLIEDQYFVPVLRSEDNSFPAVIGEPFSPASPPRIQIDPLSPAIEVKAFAGPMTKSQAVEFRKKWKTPPRNLFKTPTKRESKFNESFSCLESPNAKDLSMRLQDSEKGVEMVGRDLAEVYHVPWKEHWPFLNDFTDLRSDEGLNLLETHLLGKSKLGMYLLEFEINQRFEKMRLSSEEECNNEVINCDEIFYTPPESPVPFSKNGEDSCSEDEMFDAEPENIPMNFINGERPGKVDWAVFKAIPEQIDREVYPSIYLWRHVMSTHKQINDCHSMSRRKLLLSPN